MMSVIWSTLNGEFMLHSSEIFVVTGLSLDPYESNIASTILLLKSIDEMLAVDIYFTSVYLCNSSENYSVKYAKRQIC